MEEPHPHSEEWTPLWVQAQPVVSAFIASLIPEVNDADDILQTVALTAIRKFEVFDKNRSFVAWVIGIAKNEIHTHHRKKGKQAMSLDIKTMEHIAKVYTDDAEAVYDLRNDLNKALDQCINKLKGKWRTILELHYLRELTAARISQQLGMSKNNVLVTLSRIRGALRDCVNRQLRQETV